MDSEPAIQRRHGDLMMLIRPEMRHLSIYDLLLEFKYIPLSRLVEGKHQFTGQEIKEKSRSELVAMAPVKDELAQARQQLIDYRHTLEQKYGAVLKLRTYAVVGLGFERLIWQEVTA